jgi:hypothetical protein
MMLASDRQRLLPICCFKEFVAVRSQERPQNVAIGLIVIGNEDERRIVHRPREANVKTS